MGSGCDRVRPAEAGVTARGATFADREAVGADAGAAGAAAGAHRAGVAGVHRMHGARRDVLERHQHGMQVGPGPACGASRSP